MSKTNYKISTNKKKEQGNASKSLNIQKTVKTYKIKG